jgi:excisionase family DNA binding protein
MQVTTPKRFLTAAEAATCLGLAKSTVYDWIARGHIPCHRFGRTVRISLEDMEAYLEKSYDAGTDRN